MTGSYIIQAVYNATINFPGSTDTTVPSSASDRFTITAVPVTPPPIIGEQVLTWQNKNKKGKPIGKLMLVITLDYSTAMNPTSAGLYTNYQVTSTTTKRIKKKTVTTNKLVAVNAIYNPSNDSVKLYIKGKPSFAQGGHIKVISSPPNGVSSEGGVPLDPTDTEFTIRLNGTLITRG